MPRTITASICALLAAAALVAAALTARQTGMLDRLFIFFPSQHTTATPADLGMHYEDITFSAADGTRLHGWYIPGRTPDTLIWFHGNAGSISDRVDNILLLNQYIGVNIFIFDYRGYGKSQGAPSESGIYLDGQAALDHISARPDTDAGRIILFGRSLGGAVAAELATHNHTKAVILESTFTSIKAMSRQTRPAPLAFLPTHLIVKSRFDTLSKMRRIHTPILMAHGSQDDTIPIRMSRELYAAANAPKRFHEIPGANHHNAHAIGGAPYLAALRDFIENPSEYAGQ